MQPSSQRKRRFSTTDLSGHVGKPGDLVIDLTKETAVLMDGTTMGGIPLARADAVPPNANGTTAGLLSSADYNSLHALLAITDATETVSGYLSHVDKTALDALVSGGGGGSGPSGVSASTPLTLVLRDASGNFSANVITANLTGNVTGSLTGNASTVTNGVVTTAIYSNPGFITSLDGSKITGTISCTISSVIPWSQISGRPTAVSNLTNDIGYITSTATITGASGSVTGQTSAPTVNKVMVRDSSGRAQVAAPSLAADIATKGYVDAVSGSGNNFTIFIVAGTFTWTVPSNVNYISVLIVGGGASGAGGWQWDGTHVNPGYGGGGGGLIFIKRMPVTPGASLPVIVGPGGVATVSVPANYTAFFGSGLLTNIYNSPQPGSSSSFNSMIASPGGAKNFGGFDPYGLDFSGGFETRPVSPTYLDGRLLGNVSTVIPFNFGDSYLVIGGQGGSPLIISGSSGGSNNSGGGGGTPGGVMKNIIPTAEIGNSGNGSVTYDNSALLTTPKRGLQSIMHYPYSVGPGGGADTPGGTIHVPLFGGGGVGGCNNGSAAGWNPGQNGASGSVSIFW